MAAKTCALLGLVFLCQGAAVNHSDPKKEKLSSLISESVTICGNDYIWEDISAADSAPAIRAIDWQGIEQTIKGFLDVQQSLIETQDQKIETLQQEIDKKNGRQAARVLSNQEIESLVDESVQDQSSFGSKEGAVATNCGKPGMLFNGKRLSPEAFTQGSKVTKKVANEFWTQKKQDGDLVRSDWKTFFNVCLDNLGFQRFGEEVTAEEDLASFCDELCSDMATVVQTVSNANTQGSRDVTRLMKEKEKALQKKQKEQDKKDTCDGANTRIMAFRKYLENLNAIMEEKHELFRKAEWDLIEARNVLKKMTEHMKEQKRLMQDALNELGQAENSAKEKLEIAQQSLEDTSAELEKVTDTWNSLTADLVMVQAAERHFDEVKQRLSKLLLHMDGFAEECVREPVRNIGLSEETHVYDGNFFKPNVEDLQAHEEMKAQLDAFHIYCETIAKDVFARVTNIDLSPLCDLGDKKQTMAEIAGAVQKRKDLVVKSIQDVQSWLDPFKGTLVTSANEESDYVEEGEPLGLRRVVGPMSQGNQNNFYSNYLKKWKKKGEFQALLVTIGQKVVDLDEKVNTAASEMARLANKGKAAQTEFEEATAAFQEAAQSLVAQKETAQQISQELDDQVAQQRQTLEDLERKVKEAAEAWKLAKNNLLAGHQTETSSLSENHAAIE